MIFLFILITFKLFVGLFYLQLLAEIHTVFLTFGICICLILPENIFPLHGFHLQLIWKSMASQLRRAEVFCVFSLWANMPPGRTSWKPLPCVAVSQWHALYFRYGKVCTWKVIPCYLTQGNGRDFRITSPDFVSPCSMQKWYDSG